MGGLITWSVGDRRFELQSMKQEMHATVVQVRRLVHFMPVYVKILKHIGHTHTHTRVICIAMATTGFMSLFLFSKDLI